jgi:uncharacterized membrane protein (DUF485 family)
MTTEVTGGRLETRLPLEGRTVPLTALEHLAARRLRVALGLTAAMLVVYFGFILLIAFDKELLAEGVVDGLTVGMLLGVFVIFSTWVLTWIYVRWANRVYEPALHELEGQR